MMNKETTKLVLSELSEAYGSIQTAHCQEPGANIEADLEHIMNLLSEIMDELEESL